MEPFDTVGELIAALQHYDPDTPIRLATQPHWPFEYTLGVIALTPDDAEGDGTEPTGDPVVWIPGRSPGRRPTRDRQQRPGVVPVTAGQSALATRDTTAARRAQGADPDGFGDRHQDRRPCEYRARLVRTLAAVPGLGRARHHHHRRP